MSFTKKAEELFGDIDGLFLELGVTKGETKFNEQGAYKHFRYVFTTPYRVTVPNIQMQYINVIDVNVEGKSFTVLVSADGKCEPFGMLHGYDMCAIADIVAEHYNIKTNN